MRANVTRGMGAVHSSAGHANSQTSRESEAAHKVSSQSAFIMEEGLLTHSDAEARPSEELEAPSPVSTSSHAMRIGSQRG